MTHAMSGPVTLSLDRPNPFDPPRDLARWREEGPIRPMLYADGHVGWLVTGYEAARAVLADPRFGTDLDRLHPPVGGRLTQRLFAGIPGFFLHQDPPEHTRIRRLLTGQFTLRRAKELEPRIRQIAGELLDGMEKAGPPVDLVEVFALPLPSLVICELLGVPTGAQESFQRQSEVMLDLDSTSDQVREAVSGLMAFMLELVDGKRARPGEDVISNLVATKQLTKEEIAGVAMLLVVAGHETTANMLALGTFTLLRNPAQLAALREDPVRRAPAAVEELMRYLSIIHIGLLRTAMADVPIEGHMIRAGESVTVSLSAADRDPARFPDPDALDVTRPATGHLAFGHGVHQCIGQQLARVEMRVGYPALLERFPGLRLAVEPEQVATRSDMAIYGVHRLPVAW
ncbi:cytochrome P450 [Sphaerisporangium melleum]|uniref:Cytochrome P450 n=1 Tax=Sphaerisporangium melleum TaxID=321316 RepID=A0A917VGE5_9ACTN|nr:cytochrome P450 [Sphaerisporangium melleum]GGK72636.1 cytochrome P450 [Sphaerisporangium melleum]GII68316.1 cytochrome P450 [Sphaerisporangium melleum]